MAQSAACLHTPVDAMGQHAETEIEEAHRRKDIQPGLRRRVGQLRHHTHIDTGDGGSRCKRRPQPAGVHRPPNAGEQGIGRQYRGDKPRHAVEREVAVVQRHPALHQGEVAHRVGPVRRVDMTAVGGQEKQGTQQMQGVDAHPAAEEERAPAQLPRPRPLAVAFGEHKTAQHKKQRHAAHAQVGTGGHMREKDQEDEDKAQRLKRDDGFLHS